MRDYPLGLSVKDLIGKIHGNEKIPFGCYTKSETYTKTEVNALVGGNGTPPPDATSADIDNLLGGDGVEAEELASTSDIDAMLGAGGTTESNSDNTAASNDDINSLFN